MEVEDASRNSFSRQFFISVFLFWSILLFHGFVLHHIRKSICRPCQLSRHIRICSCATSATIVPLIHSQHRCNKPPKYVLCKVCTLKISYNFFSSPHKRTVKFDRCATAMQTNDVWIWTEEKINKSESQHTSDDDSTPSIQSIFLPANLSINVAEKVNERPCATASSNSDSVKFRVRKINYTSLQGEK